MVPFVTKWRSAGGNVRAHRTLLVVAVVVVLVCAACAPWNRRGWHRGVTTGPVPAITGPVTGGTGSINLLAPGVGLHPSYVGQEFFLQGTAESYAPTAPLGSDGRWNVKPAAHAPYKTRIVVYRPSDPAHFNGTVFVEWLNVSAGFETAPDWGSAHNWITRSGAAWVGVSAQAAGVQGGEPTVAGLPPGGLRAADPVRYGSLSHPGDAFSYDMFSQAGRAVEARGATSPLGGLKVKEVIAAGESQSAFRMVTYINAVNPLAHVFDGFLVHSRSASGAGLGTSTNSGVGDADVPATTITRDAGVPVLTLETETDLLSLGYAKVQQADSAHSRLWEVAGAAHADAYTGLLGFGDTGDGKAELSLLDPTKANGGPLACSQPINSGPAFAVLSAAMANLDQWVKIGVPPRPAPRLAIAADGSLVRDVHGNATGGVRTASVDVPVATITGLRNAGGSFCSLFGTTTPFDAAKLAALYPTHDQYVRAFDRATLRSELNGWMLPTEANHFTAAARQLAVPPAQG
jgi:Alpha/beta hydrolase domain